MFVILYVFFFQSATLYRPWRPEFIKQLHVRSEVKTEQCNCARSGFESREHRRFLKDQETWVFLNVIAEQLSVSGQEASFLWFLDPRTPSYSIWDKWQSCLLHLSLVVFASFPSSFLSWSTPIIKLPIRPTWTEEKRRDKNVTLVVSQVRDIGTSFGIHDTKQFTNQTVIIKRQSEVHLQGLNSNTSHTLPLG